MDVLDKMDVRSSSGAVSIYKPLLQDVLFMLAVTLVIIGAAFFITERANPFITMVELMFILMFMPFIVLFSFTSKKSANPNSLPPSYPKIALIIGAFLLCAAVVPMFAMMLNVVTFNTQAGVSPNDLIAMFVEPGMGKWIIRAGSQEWLWLSISAAAFIASFVLMMFLVRRELRTGVGFRLFALGMILYGLGLRLIAYCQKAEWYISILAQAPSWGWLLDWTMYLLCFVVVYYGVKVAYQMAKRPWVDGDKKTLKMGCLVLFSLSMSTEVMMLPLKGVMGSLTAFHVELLRRNSPDDLLSHCRNASPDEQSCWAVSLLKRHGLEVSQAHVQLLHARNGHYQYVDKLPYALDIDEAWLQSNHAFPEEFLALFGEGIYRKYTHAQYYNIMPSSAFYKSKEGSGEGVAIDVSQYERVLKADFRAILDLAKLAKEDRQAFLVAYQKAPEHVQHVRELSSLHSLLVGERRVKDRNHKDGTLLSRRYLIGDLSFYVRDGKVSAHFDEVASAAQFRAIMQIPSSELPAVKG